jgi:hypothetical protein
MSRTQTWRTKRLIERKKEGNNNTGSTTTTTNDVPENGWNPESSPFQTVVLVSCSGAPQGPLFFCLWWPPLFVHFFFSFKFLLWTINIYIQVAFHFGHLYTRPKNFASLERRRSSIEVGPAGFPSSMSLEFHFRDSTLLFKERCFRCVSKKKRQKLNLK